jgi:mono/diheme cytochrome c family protein
MTFRASHAVRRSMHVGAFGMLVTCGLHSLAEPSQLADPTPVRFSAIETLFARNCAACHNSEDRVAGLVLGPGTYETIVGKQSTESRWPLITPFKPDESYLYAKISGKQVERGGTGIQMPGGLPPLPDADIELVRRWIEQGARP